MMTALGFAAGRRKLEEIPACTTNSIAKKRDKHKDFVESRRRSLRGGQSTQKKVKM
jgi:hypothetical protein